MEPNDIVAIIDALKLQTTTILLGWMGLIVGLIIKDILTAAAFGLVFFLDPQFKEGDYVYIDGEEAIIQKIGLTITIFKIINTSRWRYIRNEKIRYHNLEKAIEEKRDKK